MAETARHLDLLVVEDVSDDAELLVRVIRRGGYEVEYEVVASASEMRDALARRTWQLVVSDYHLPGFGGIEALRLLREHDPDTPLILYSGVITEEDAVRALREGAADFVSKQRMARLLPAIERELRDAEDRRLRREAEQELEREAEALRASQAKLAMHIEQTMLGVVELDADLRIREWNPAAEAIFACPREEAMGRPVLELVVPDRAAPQVEAVLRDLMEKGGRHLVTVDNITKDGRSIVCEWANTSLLDDGVVTGIMSLIRDVTEHRQAEQLRVAKEAAEASSNAKSAFLANMTHEIRTPMNAILGFAQLLRDDAGLSDRQRQQLDIINGSGEHLLALINDVLEMSRIEAGRATVNLGPLNLYALLDEMESLFGLRAEGKGLRLDVARSSEVPQFVVTDEGKLRQVLVNLLGNAVKFTDEGSVALRVSAQSDGDRTMLFAEVRDTGRGISPEDARRLFHYFEQAAAQDVAQVGTGLGLAISREFVHLLGGDISVESTPGEGSTFSFSIVVEETTADALVDGGEERRVLSLASGQPEYRVLVVDDAPESRELLTSLLDPVGFCVRLAANGEEAVAAFAEWHPHAILMDMRMPVMSGYEATRRIRAAEGDARHVAIIAVTASAFSEMRQAVYDAGVDELITKPIHGSEVLGAIGRILGLRYDYEEPTPTERREQGTLDRSAVAQLPDDIVSRLTQATLAADFDAVLAIAEDAARFDERAAAALRILAERFDAESILDALPTRTG